jgi:benzoyl-CoA-dihydrodiol lyase
VVKPARFAEFVRERAQALAAQSDRPADAQGVRLTPLTRTVTPKAIGTKPFASTSTASRRATITVSAPDAGQPGSGRHLAAGAQWWPLKMARELDDAILTLRTNHLDIGMWILKTTGDAAQVLAADALMDAHASHWFVRETIGMLRRTLARLDVSSRSLFALVEPGSCFAGTLLELALAADRAYMLQLPDTPDEAPAFMPTSPTSAAIRCRTA